MTQPALLSRRSIGGPLALLLLTLLSACSQTPNDDAIQNALNQELHRAHLGELLEVAAVDSVDRHRESGDHYTVDVQYTLRAKRNLADYDSAVKNDQERDTMDRFAMIMTLGAVRQQFGDFKKGDTFKQQRRITLERDQAGWRIPRPAPPPKAP